MTNHLDPVSVAVVLASTLFGPQLAGIIGPYAVILIGATLGASWSLGGQERKSNMAAARHFILLGATAMLVTVPVANGLAQWIGMSSSTWMLVPIAILIGSVGDAWPRVVRWALALAGRVIERRSGGGGSGQ